MVKVHNSERLNGAKILITGATGGLGFSVHRFGARGCHYAIGKDKTRLEIPSDAIEQTKGTITLVCIDLAKQGTIEELSNKISEKFGKLDVIIHCAMPSLNDATTQVSLEELEINLLSIMISLD